MGRGIGNPSVTRLLVIFLRFYARMTQGQLAAASRVHQPEISAYEAGDKVPTEKTQRRLTAAVGLEWPVVVHLRRAFEAVIAIADRRALAAGPAYEDLEAAAADLAMLTVTPYLMQVKALAVQEQTREQAVQEAEEIWTGLAPFAAKQRRKLIEAAPRASRNWALALLACQDSASEAGDAEEARELAELAVAIAERAPGTKEWKNRLRGHCLAHLARAQERGERLDEATRNYDRAWSLWQAGADLEPPALPEWPLQGVGGAAGSAGS